MAVNTKWHSEQVKKFSQLLPEYQMYATVLSEILTKAANLYAPSAIVQVRAKSIPSFAEKAIRKAFKYQDPVHQITDLCGARIITDFQSQADAICQFIRKNFEVDEANSLDVSSRLAVSEFGYLSVHYVVTPKADEIMGVKIPKAIKDKKAEIQVRTLLQHAWADISHDRIYKTPISVPERWRRETARLAAIMENADNAFALLAETLDTYTANYGAMMNEDQLAEEIDVLKTILKNEIDSKNKPLLALRLARVLKIGARWDQIIGTLESLINTEGKTKAAILIELGNAYCQKNKANPNSNDFRRGQKCLEEVARPKEPVAQEKAYEVGQIIDREALHLRSEALHLLGCSFSRLKKWNLARDYCQMAHQVDPANPYYFASYVEFEVTCTMNTDIVSLVRQSLFEAIEQCRNHIRISTHTQRAYLTIGKLLLIMGETNRGLNAYCRAIDLCVSGKTCTPEEFFDDEIGLLKRLEAAGIPNVALVMDILQLGMALKFKDKKMLKALRAKVKRTGQFERPIIIIAGGAEDMPKTKMPDYLNFLTYALQRYRGTIIAGGTTSGIPGLVGLSKSAAEKTGNRDCRLIAYIPKRMPKNAKQDPCYDELVRTEGSDFTALELIQYWTDIVLSGIEPSDVLVLGINGGQISDLEYRLALAMGATVGLIESSGRAATGLLLDEDWLGHERVLVLPQDAISIWAFVNQRKPSLLTNEQIEEAAPKVHEYYREKKIRDRNTDDPAMLPWEQLAENLRQSNRRQVSFIEEVLLQLDYGIREATDIEPVKFDKALLNRMAEMEHARWLVERLADGWKYGPRKDLKKKISPYLVSWDKLPDSVKDWDIHAVSKFPEILKDAGFELYKL